MKPKLASLTFALLSMLAAPVAKSAVTFTFTGTIQSADSTAFSVSETVTVVMTTIEGLGAPNIENSATNVHWETNGTGTVWSSITVSGATGTYNPATTTPTGWLESGDRRDSFYAAAFDDTDIGIGLFRNGEEIVYVDCFVSPATLVAAMYAANSSVTPESTFINGTYDVTSATLLDDNSFYFYTDGYAHEYIGQISTIQVSGATIPEPSQAILSAAGLGLLWVRRRGRAARNGDSHAIGRDGSRVAGVSAVDGQGTGEACCGKRLVTTGV